MFAGRAIQEDLCGHLVVDTAGLPNAVLKSVVRPVTVTYLEMRAPESLRPKAAPDPRFRVEEVVVRQWELNRFLYLEVGRDWCWNEKRKWSEEQWKRYVEADHLRTFVGYLQGSPVGYYELRGDVETGVEIAIFGLLPRFVGKGFGGALLTSALQEGWRSSPPRVWLHTCSLDHPAALPNYQARGLKVYRIETLQVDV